MIPYWYLSFGIPLAPRIRVWLRMIRLLALLLLSYLRDNAGDDDPAEGLGEAEERYPWTPIRLGWFLPVCASLSANMALDGLRSDNLQAVWWHAWTPLRLSWDASLTLGPLIVPIVFLKTVADATSMVCWINATYNTVSWKRSSNVNLISFASRGRIRNILVCQYVSGWWASYVVLIDWYLHELASTTSEILIVKFWTHATTKVGSVFQGSHVTEQLTDKRVWIHPIVRGLPVSWHLLSPRNCWKIENPIALWLGPERMTQSSP